MNKIGAAEVIIARIATTVDGGMQITLSFSSQDVDLVQKLMQIKMDNPLVTVAFLQSDEKSPQQSEEGNNDDWKNP